MAKKRHKVAPAGAVSTFEVRPGRRIFIDGSRGLKLCVRARI